MLGDRVGLELISRSDNLDENRFAWIDLSPSKPFSNSSIFIEITSVFVDSNILLDYQYKILSNIWDSIFQNSERVSL